MARLRSGPPRNRGSIADTGRKFLSSPKGSDQLWCPNNTKFSGYRSLFTLEYNHSLPYRAENKWSYASASLSLSLWEPRYSVWITDWAIEQSGATEPSSLLRNVQTDSGGPPSVIANAKSGNSCGEKRLWHVVDHSPPSSAEAKNAGIYTSITPYNVMV
jgi:hypothetical protein